MVKMFDSVSVQTLPSVSLHLFLKTKYIPAVNDGFVYFPDAENTILIWNILINMEFCTAARHLTFIRVF